MLCSSEVLRANDVGMPSNSALARNDSDRRSSETVWPEEVG